MSDGWAPGGRPSAGGARSMDALQTRNGLRRAQEQEFLAAMGVVADAVR